MSPEEVDARVAEIVRFLDAARPAWPVLLTELDAIESSLIEALITQDNPEARGRIKAIRSIKELPFTLQAERDGLIEGLAE